MRERQTHHELGNAAADELGVAVLAFLADGNWPGRLWDEDAAALAWVKNFRNELNRNAKFFKWEEDSRLPQFRALLSQELANYRLRGQFSPPAAQDPSVSLRVPEADPPLPPQPYPLLAPYEHPRTFGGRTADIAKLANLARLPPLVLCVHAPSGAGKSSLLLSGLAPYMPGQGYTVSVERAPGNPGLAQRLIRDILSPPESVVLADADPALPAKFAGWIARAYALSGKPLLLVLDQVDDVLRNPSLRDEVLSRIGPLMAATAQRLPGMQGFACKWILSYRHEFHGEVRAWLEDILDEARKLARGGIEYLPHDLSDKQKSHDWALPVLGKPAPGDQAQEQSKRAFLDTITCPLNLQDKDGRPHYPYVFQPQGAERLAAMFALARQNQPDAPLVPELQVVLNHLLQRANDLPSETTPENQPVTVEVPPNDLLDAELTHALSNHLNRALAEAFPERRNSFATRLDRTRALLALRQLADSEGRRAEGLPEDELIKMLGPDGDSILRSLSSPEARLVVVLGGKCTLSHDRLAEVITSIVKNEASRGNLVLDQTLIDLQRIIGQKVALHESDPNDESALTVTRSQRALIEGNLETLVFDVARRSWWQDIIRYARHLAAKRIRLAAALIALAILVCAILSPPHVAFNLETYNADPAEWTVAGENGHLGNRKRRDCLANQPTMVGAHNQPRAISGIRSEPNRRLLRGRDPEGRYLCLADTRAHDSLE